MSWHERMTAFDLETTSADPETARIVQATVVHIDGRVVDAHTWLVDPGVEIPAEAAEIHGITTERARAEGLKPAPTVLAILSQLSQTWRDGRPVVIYNAPYDLTVLDRELRRHAEIDLGDVGPVIDPFVIDKHLDPYRKGKRTLTACCEHYRVRLDGAHDATFDALAAARLAWRLAEVYPQQLADLSTLNALQADWREQWAINFEDYLRSQGKPETIDRHWPLRPLVSVTS